MNTHAIVFHDKSKKLISQQTHDAIWQLSGSGQEKLKIGDSLIAFSSIAKILPIQEFYEQYPKERESQMSLEYKNYNGFGVRGLIEEAKAKNCLQELIKGVKKYINSTEQNPVCPNGKDKRWYKGGQEPIELSVLMEKKLTNNLN